MTLLEHRQQAATLGCSWSNYGLRQTWSKPKNTARRKITAAKIRYVRTKTHWHLARASEKCGALTIYLIDIYLSVNTSKTNMVLVLSATFDTNAINSFFTGADQINLSIHTRDQIVVEGISSPVDPPEFNKDDVSLIVQAFERPPRVPNGAGNLVNQTPSSFLQNRRSAFS